jgi:hypothetical protein
MALRVMRFADQKTTDAVRFDWLPDGNAISVSPDEHSALVTRQDDSGSDLTLVDPFR